MPSTGTIKVSDKEKEARIERAVQALRDGAKRDQLMSRGFPQRVVREAAKRIKKERSGKKISLRWQYVDRSHVRELRDDWETEE